jgi:hypothetical protein
MASTPHDRRRAQLLSTARANPAFALRVVNELSAPTRGTFVAELARPEPRPLERRPGIAKCVRSPYSEANGLAAQLAVFARGARR